MGSEAARGGEHQTWGGRRGESAINPRGAGEGSPAVPAPARMRPGAGKELGQRRGARGLGGAGVPDAAGGAPASPGGAARSGLAPHPRWAALDGGAAPSLRNGGRGSRGAPRPPRGSRGGDTPRRAPGVTSAPAEPPFPAAGSSAGAGARGARAGGSWEFAARRRAGRRAAQRRRGPAPAPPAFEGGAGIVPACPGAAGERAGGAGNNVSIGGSRRVSAPLAVAAVGTGGIRPLPLPPPLARQGAAWGPGRWPDPVRLGGIAVAAALRLNRPRSSVCPAGCPFVIQVSWRSGIPTSPFRLYHGAGGCSGLLASGRLGCWCPGNCRLYFAEWPLCC